MQKALVAHGLQIPRGAILYGLTALFFESEGVADGNAMLAVLGRMKPDMLVIDAELPPFGAVEAIRSARGFDSGDKKIIAILKNSDFERAGSLRTAGAHEVIMGGYDSQKLEAKLRVLGLLQT